MEDAAPLRRGIFAKFFDLVDASLSSRYMQANIVYLVYTSLIMYINLSLAPKADDAYTDDVCVAAPSPFSSPLPPPFLCCALCITPPPRMRTRAPRAATTATTTTVAITLATPTTPCTA